MDNYGDACWLSQNSSSTKCCETYESVILSFIMVMLKLRRHQTSFARLLNISHCRIGIWPYRVQSGIPNIHFHVLECRLSCWALSHLTCLVQTSGLPWLSRTEIVGVLVRQDCCVGGDGIESQRGVDISGMADLHSGSPSERTAVNFVSILFF